MLATSAFKCLMPSWTSYFDYRTFYVAVKALCLMHRWPKKVGFWKGQVYTRHQGFLVQKDLFVPSRGRHRSISMLIISPQNSEKRLCPNTWHRHSRVRGIDHGMAFLFVFEDVGSKNLCLGYLTSIQHVVNGFKNSMWYFQVRYPGTRKIAKRICPCVVCVSPCKRGFWTEDGQENKYLFPVF